MRTLNKIFGMFIILVVLFTTLTLVYGSSVDRTFQTLTVPATDVLAESTVGAGVTVDGFKIKDGGIDPSVWPAFRAYLSSNQGNIIGIEKIEFDTDDFDTNNNFGTGGNKFVPTVAGKYLLTSTVKTTGSALGDSILIMLFRDDNIIAESSIVSSGGIQSISITDVVSTDGTKEYTIKLINNNRDTMDVTGNRDSTWFSGSMIAQ